MFINQKVLYFWNIPNVKITHLNVEQNLIFIIYYLNWKKNMNNRVKIKANGISCMYNNCVHIPYIPPNITTVHIVNIQVPKLPNIHKHIYEKISYL